MVWYGIHLDHVEALFKQFLDLIDVALPNEEIFNFNEHTDLDELASEWSAIMIRRKGHDLMKGTILAGDGLVVEIQAPSAEDRAGLDLNSYRNRKGYFGLIVQAFYDAFGMFRSFDIRCPGATPDITAHKQSPLYRLFMDKKIPCWFHMVLDEAYSSVGGDQYLTPFSKHQLRTAKNRSEDEYCRMKTFNNILSSQRITIERAFGMYVRKWGILWRPLAYSQNTNMKIIKVCAKLHNVCILETKESGSRRDEISRMQADYSMSRDAGVFMGWEGGDRLANHQQELPNDDEVRDMMENRVRPIEPAARRVSDRKQQLMQNMHACGIRYDFKSDDFFFNG